MKVDGGVGWELDKVGAEAKALEDMGYSSMMTAETSHDPFFPLLVAAMHTQRVAADDGNRGCVRAHADGSREHRSRSERRV